MACGYCFRHIWAHLRGNRKPKLKKKKKKNRNYLVELVSMNKSYVRIVFDDREAKFPVWI